MKEKQEIPWDKKSSRLIKKINKSLVEPTEKQETPEYKKDYKNNFDRYLFSSTKFGLILSSIGFGLIFILIVISEARNNPLLFMILWLGGSICANIVFLFYKYRNNFGRDNRKELTKRFFSFNSEFDFQPLYQGQDCPSIFNFFNRRSILSRTKGLEMFLFSWALVYIHDLVAAMIFVGLLTLLQPLRYQDQYQDQWSRPERPRFKKGLVVLVVVILIAVVSIVLAEDATAIFSAAPFSGNYILGLILLVVAVPFGVPDATRGALSHNFVGNLLANHLANNDNGNSLEKARTDMEKARIDMEKAPADNEKARDDWKKARDDWKKARDDWKKANADWKKAPADMEKAPAGYTKANADWKKANADWKKANADWKKAPAGMKARARVDYVKAYADYVKANANWEKAPDYTKARADYEKANANWEKARADYVKANTDWRKAPANMEKAFANDSKNEFSVQKFLEVLALGTSVVGMAIAFALFETFNIFQGFSGVLTISGMFIAFFGGVLVSVVFIISRNLDISKYLSKGKKTWQTIEGSAPILGVLFFIIFSFLRDVLPGVPTGIPSISAINWSWFIVGFIGILSVSIVINFETKEARFDFTTLVVVLWLSGLLVFFRDEWAWWVDNINLLSPTTLEYYSFVGASATIFAFLIAFEITRIQQRTTREEELVFSLLARFETIYPEDEQILMDLKKLDTATTIDNSDTARRMDNNIKIHYESIIEKLEDRKGELHQPRVSETKFATNESIYLNETITELNILAHSKQRGRGASESIVIVLLAVFTMVLSFVLRPADINSLAAIMVDIFGFLLAAAVAYLIFHLFNLRSTRTRSTIEKQPLSFQRHLWGYEDSNSYRVEFDSSLTLKHESIAAITIISIIVITYSVLLCIKWLA